MVHIVNEVMKAQERLQNYLSPTPLIYAYQLSKLTKANVYLKMENIQPTASFKVRGAFNKLLSLTEAERKLGVITASTGNHGAAVAFAANKLNIACEVYVPNEASITKINAIKSYGAEIKFYGNECGETEQYARQQALKNNKIYISPYNDLSVIAGQGTIGYELLTQLRSIDYIFASIGGGGLISGIAGYIKNIKNDTDIIGCLPQNSPVMVECIKAGKIIKMETENTLSDATAGNMELNSITFPFCQRYVDNYELVSEEEIKNAMQFLLEKEHLLAEGSVGVAIASLFKLNEKLKSKNVVIIFCGANISLEAMKRIIC